uniref:Uncharacterized protein n=1 Tax=Oryza barthii TaxID=65489 RepID=A0A0D3G1M6_9ORYZ
MSGRWEERQCSARLRPKPRQGWLAGRRINRSIAMLPWELQRRRRPACLYSAKIHSPIATCSSCLSASPHAYPIFLHDPSIYPVRWRKFH